MNTFTDAKLFFEAHPSLPDSADREVADAAGRWMVSAQGPRSAEGLKAQDVIQQHLEPIQNPIPLYRGTSTELKPAGFGYSVYKPSNSLVSTSINPYVAEKFAKPISGLYGPYAHVVMELNPSADTPVTNLIESYEMKIIQDRLENSGQSFDDYKLRRSDVIDSELEVVVPGTPWLVSTTPSTLSSGVDDPPVEIYKAVQMPAATWTNLDKAADVYPPQSDEQKAANRAQWKALTNSTQWQHGYDVFDE